MLSLACRNSNCVQCSINVVCLGRAGEKVRGANARIGWRQSAPRLRQARTNPVVFFATCARLIPNDVRVTVQQQSPGTALL